MMKKTVFLLTIVISVLLQSNCGIPNYPYLYPPIAFEDVSVGFEHDPDNDPNVFQGYEIYYRIYSIETSDSQILSEMNSFFSGISAFSSVSDDSTFADTNKKYRRVVLYDENKQINFNDLDGGLPPHMPISNTDCDINFEVSFIGDNDDFLVLTFSSNYVGSNDVLYGFRNIDSETDVTSAFFKLTDYTVEDSDVKAAGISGSFPGSLKAAFFAVPYGEDDITQIFANNTSGDMRFLGTIEVD